MTAGSFHLHSIMHPALSAKLEELGYSDALTSITAEHVLFVLRKLLLVPEPGSEDCSHAEQSALVVAGMDKSAALACPPNRATPLIWGPILLQEPQAACRTWGST